MKFLGTSVGVIEWYDNAICIALADVISKIFFPEFDLQARFLFYWGSLAIGYLGRPIGAFIFGLYSDKVDRIKSAYIAFLLMIVSSLIISFLPGYSKIGIYAPILFIAMRLMQGVAIGGNYGVSIINVEQAHNSEKYFSSSLVSVGIFSGILLGSFTASILNYLASSDFLLNYGWRIGLWSSALFSIPVFISFHKLMKQPKQSKVKKHEEMIKTKLNFKLIFKVFTLFLLDMVPFYILFTFLPNYKIMFLGQDASQVWFYHTISMFVIVSCTPFFGKLADMYGALNVLKMTTIGLVLVAPFAPWIGLGWNIVFGVLMSMCYGCLYGFTALLFPSNIRARSSGFIFNIAGSLVGGGIPIISSYLAQKSFYYISLLLGLVCISVLLILFRLEEKQSF